jgi:hypothetical protein
VNFLLLFNSLPPLHDRITATALRSEYDHVVGQAFVPRARLRCAAARFAAVFAGQMRDWPLPARVNRSEDARTVSGVRGTDEPGARLMVRL